MTRTSTPPPPAIKNRSLEDDAPEISDYSTIRCV
jgi:hypothetical protein